MKKTKRKKTIETVKTIKKQAKRSVILLLSMLLTMTVPMSSCKSNGATDDLSDTSNNLNPSDSANPIVTIEMDDNSIIKIELYPDTAPISVNNFISIINLGYLDGTIFHRVSPTFMIQGGEMVNGELDYTIKGEFSQNGVENNLKHERGVISMARTNVMDSATTQFFIMTEDSSFLDGGYAAFGKVIEGMDVVDNIANSEWSVAYGDGTGKPDKDRVMKKVTVDTFGKEYPEPEKIK